MATLTNLRTEVYNRLSLDSTSSGTDETEVTRALNQAVVDVLLQTGVYRTSANTTLTAGQSDYTLDTGILRIYDAYTTSNSERYKIEAVSPYEITELRNTAGDDRSSPAIYYALSGANLLMVYPTPSSADTITFYYTPRPTALSSGSHDTSNSTYGGIPDEFYPALVEYACWKVGQRYDRKDVDRFFAAYQQYWLPKILKFVNVKASPSPPRMRLRRGGPRVHRDPSADRGF